MDRLLSERERGVWEALLRTSWRAMGLVARDLASVGLSGAEFAVLLLLSEAGDRMDQGALREALGWDKSRLSHQLTRMEARGLVARAKGRGRTAEVLLRPTGEARLATARPVHAASVRRNLLDRLPERVADALVEAASLTDAL